MIKCQKGDYFRYYKVPAIRLSIDRLTDPIIMHGNMYEAIVNHSFCLFYAEQGLRALDEKLNCLLQETLEIPHKFQFSPSVHLLYSKL